MKNDDNIQKTLIDKREFLKSAVDGEAMDLAYTSEYTFDGCYSPAKHSRIKSRLQRAEADLIKFDVENPTIKGLLEEQKRKEKLARYSGDIFNL